MCSDENGFPSDKAAARLRDELKSTLIDLFQGGNLDAINEKLNDRAPTTTPETVRLTAAEKRTPGGNFLVSRKKLIFGEQVLFLEKSFRADATPEQLVYGVLRRALESGDIKRLALCEQCQRLFYRGSLKRKFCSDPCQWTYHNRSEKRKKHYIKGKWYR